MVLVQGVGAADKLWSTALDYIDVVGSPYAQVSVPSVGVSNSMQSLYAGLVCDATLREMGANPGSSITSNPGSYYCNSTNNQSFCGQPPPVINPSATTVSTLQLGPNGDCGTLHYCVQDPGSPNTSCADPNSASCKACVAQVKVLADIVNTTLQPMAQYFEQTDYSYRNFYFQNDPNVASGGGGGFNTGWLSGYCSQQGLGGSSKQCCVPNTPNCKATTNPFQSFQR